MKARKPEDAPAPALLLDEETGDPRQELRRKRSKPQGRRSAAQLDLDSDQADSTVTMLREKGYLDEVLGELKSGKEATVYLARGPRGLIALKIYRDLRMRSFKNDQLYQAGRNVADARIARAVKARSKTGLEAQQVMWTAAEYAMLWRLWTAGLPVPEPLVGPSSKDCAATAPAVLMRFIGDEDAAAPRLSEAELTPAEAQAAWDQSLTQMAALLRLGLVHGDYSTYNLLWWEDTVIIIDFPQVSDRSNPNFQTLLERDAESLARSFGRHGVRETGEAVLREVQRRAKQAAPPPRIQLP